MVSYILALVCGLAVLGLDQYTKYIANTAYINGKFNEPVDFINGFIKGVTGSALFIALLTLFTACFGG